MRTQKGMEIELKINELTDKFENYSRSLFDEWKRNVSIQIQEKIAYPLFTINNDKTIGLNFDKEVIILHFKLFTYFIIHYLIYLKLDAAIKVTRYLLLGKYNYKNPMVPIEIEEIPYDAIELFKRENAILGYKRDIDEIVKWLVTIGNYLRIIFIPLKKYVKFKLLKQTIKYN